MLRHTVFCLVIATSLHAAPACAQQFPEVQRGVMENIAQAFAGTAKCNRYKVNTKVIVLVQLRYGVNISNPRVNNYIEERAKFHRDRIASRTDADICEALNRLFGPNGSNLANLIVPK